MAAINRFIREEMYRKRIAELQSLIIDLRQKMESKQIAQDQQALAEETLLRLREQLWRYQDGPSGNGPAFSLDVVSTGCQSVYKSTYPYTPKGSPAVNSLFHDSAPTALGMHAGLSHASANEFKAVRIAKLLIDSQYNPAEHEQFFIHFGSAQFTEEELLLAPAIIAYHGDGAANDIGFGAISRALMTKAPIKIAVLDTQAYSNTGGQTSTASPVGSDTDLSKFGSAQQGKQENRKELGILAMLHQPNVFVAQIATGNLGHFYRGMQGALEYNQAPALVNTYTACPPEHGTPDNASMERAKLVTRSRAFPIFIRDPQAGATLAEQLSLDKNLSLERDWVIDNLVSADGIKRDIPYTFAHFAHEEGRFAKHFKKLEDGFNAETYLPIQDLLKLPQAEREDKKAFIEVLQAGKFVRYELTATMVVSTEERLTNWRLLQELAGITNYDAQPSPVSQTLPEGGLDQIAADNPD